MLVPRRVSGITFIWYAQNRTTVFNRIKLGTDGDCMPVLNGQLDHKKLSMQLQRHIVRTNVMYEKEH